MYETRNSKYTFLTVFFFFALFPLNSIFSYYYHTVTCNKSRHSSKMSILQFLYITKGKREEKKKFKTETCGSSKVHHILCKVRKNVFSSKRTLIFFVTHFRVLYIYCIYLLPYNFILYTF